MRGSHTGGKLRAALRRDVMDTLWNRTKHAFEKIIKEGEQATQPMVESLGEMADAAKARLERARLRQSGNQSVRKSDNQGARSAPITRVTTG